MKLLSPGIFDLASKEQQREDGGPLAKEDAEDAAMRGLVASVRSHSGAGTGGGGGGGPMSRYSSK